MELNVIKTSEEMPANCKPVNVFTTYRFKHYKESSSQFKNGMVGRWQEFNGYGWSNAEAPDSWIKENDSE